MRLIPEKLINYTVYQNGSTFLGTADITLPSLEALTETIKGAGIAGEIDSPTIGHFGSMTVGLNWRTITPEAIKLHAPVSHALDFRGSQQVYNSAAGAPSSEGIKVSVRTMPKSGDLGKFDPGTTTDTTNELEVTYIKITLNGRVLLELDKLNFKYIVDGVDYLAEIRDQLGL